MNIAETKTLDSTDLALKDVNASKSGKVGTTTHVFGGFSTKFTFGRNLDSRATTMSAENELSQNKKDEAEIASKALGDCVKPPPIMLFGEKKGHSGSEDSSKVVNRSQCKTGEENELTVFKRTPKFFSMTQRA